MFFKKKKLTETEFSTKFANELLKRVEGLKIVSINELEITAEFEASNEFRHFLDNCYNEYSNEPKEINEILEKYLNGAQTLYLPKESIIIDNIIPIIKDRRFLQDLEDINADFEQNHIFEFYNSELVIFYAEDKENCINYLTKEDLKVLEISLKFLKEKAIENLNNLLSIERSGDDKYYMITAGGNYESSIILLDIWDVENFPVDGNIVIGIPARDILLITGSNDSENLHRMYDVVNQINQTGDHLVSNKLFELNNGKFEVIK